MRTFIAVEIGDKARSVLSDLISDLGERFPETRWSRPENIHITLCFPGEIDEKLLPGICSALKRAVTDLQPFFLSLGEPDSFGGRSRRVMYLKVAGETDKLKSLQAKIGDELETAGFSRDKRPFKSHLTLGRDKRADLPGSWKDFTLKDNTEFTVEKITLFSSELTRSGPIYTSLACFGLDSKE